MAEAIRHPHLISLAAGFVDNVTLPCHSVAACLQAVLADESRLRKSLQYDSTAGNLQLRETLAEWCYRDYPAAKPQVDRIILGAGSNQLLHLIAETMYDPGDIVLAASPTYFVYMGTLHSMGVRVIGVQADENGMCLDSLQEHLERLAANGEAHLVKAIYIVTDFDNPSGSTLSLPRRQGLLDIARNWRQRHGPLLVLSDNAYQHLRYKGEPLPPLLALADDASEFVVDLGTFSKSFSPGIRVGWGVFPSAIIDHLLGVKSSIDFGSPHFAQVLMTEVIRSSAWENHQPGLLNAYRLKLQAMLAALDAKAGSIPGITWRQPQGGLYVWLSLPEHLDASENGPLWTAATQQGVLYVPGHHCFPSEGQPILRNTIRLSFGVLGSEKLTEGIERLCNAIESVAG